MKILTFIYKVMYHLSPLFPDEIYLKVQHRAINKERLDLSNPKSFQEKLQWIKIYDRKPEYHDMVDKYESKRFIAERVGSQYAIPTLQITESFAKIDLNPLPNKFIIKCTHDSGSYYICSNKNNFNWNEARKRLHVNSNNKDYFYSEREWPYKGLKRRFMIEPLLAEPDKLLEYKFFCFNGEPKFYQSCQDRNNDIGGAILNFFDCDGNLMDLQDGGHIRSSNIIPPKPINLQKMIEISRIISGNTYFLRVDFYEVDSTLYVGEMTFFENGAYCTFTPEKYNRILGDWIDITK